MPLVPAPAPGGLPLLGHAPQMLRRRLVFLESLRELGPAATIRLGRGTVTVLNDRRMVRDVLSNRAADFGLSPHFGVMKRIIGNGLLATDGPFHRRQRKLLMPAMRHARMASYAHTISELTDRRLDALRSAPQPLDTDRLLMSLATESVARCLFSSGVDQRQVERVAAAVPVLMEWAGSRGMDPTGLLARLPTPLNRRFRTAMRTLDSLVGGLIAARTEAGSGAPERDGGDLLDAMLHATDAGTGERMSQRQAHDEAMSFLIAGTESVSRTLTWALHLLARDSRVRAKLYAEADAVLAGRTARWEDLPRLPYTRQVLNEVLRLYPPGYLISRSAVRDTAVRATDGAEMPVAAREMVMFSYYALQRDPALFPDPAAFRPERWAADVPPTGTSATEDTRTEATHSDPAAVTGPAREAYLPFGLGPHGCLGESFAWTEMSLVLASLAARWELRPVRGRAPRTVAAFSLSFDDARMTAVPRVPGPRGTGPVTHPTGK